VLAYILKNKGWIFFGVLFTFINTLLDIPLPFIVKTVIDRIIIAGQREILAPVIILLAILIPLKVLGPFFQRYFTGKLIRKSTFLIRQAILKRFVHLEMDMYNKRGPGYFSSRIFNDCDTLIGNLYYTFIPLLQNLLILTAAVVSMLLLKPILAAVPIALIPVYIYINLSLGKQVKKKNEVLAENRAKFFETFNDIMQSIHSIRIAASENLHRLNFLQKDKRYLRQTVSVFKTESLLEAFNSFFSTIVPVMVLIAGIILILNKRMTLGEYVAFSSFLGYFLGTVRFFFSSNINLQQLKVAFGRVSEIFDWPVSHEFAEEERLPCPGLPAVIRFDAVDFSYIDDQCALTGINFSIAPGEKVILMGKSGSGKSTILNLLLGLYLPGRGQVKIAGVPTTEIDIIKLRKNTSFLKQEPLLFEGDIVDNICLFKKKRDNDLLQKSLLMANLFEFVQRLPQGLNTKIERFGNNFSVGERQRIVLCSAFYRDTQLIVFDEPTSSIDYEGTRRIIDSIKKIPRDRTVIIATHNRDLIECGDRLITIENGRITGNEVLSYGRKEDEVLALKNETREMSGMQPGKTHI
jgi:ABC-type bacteriocin/lantibiotic exporter with double-glycine peptidase domain